MASEKKYTRERFFKELKFWLWPSMSKSRLKEYLTAFEEFFARGKLTGSSDEKLVQSIGKPYDLAQKLVSGDNASVSNPFTKIIIAATILVLSGVCCFADVAINLDFSWAIYFGAFGVMLPIIFTIICGTPIFMHTQWNKNVIVRISCSAIIAVIVAACVLGGNYSRLLFDVFNVIVLLSMAFQFLFLMKDGAVMVPTTLLSGEVIVIINVIKMINIRYGGKEQLGIMLSTTKWQIIPLCVELLLFCAMLMIGWQYLLYRKKAKDQEQAENK